MSVIEKSIDLNVPVRTAYNQWVSSHWHKPIIGL